MSTLDCCCCTIQVNPVDSYGHAVVGATVDLFWNAATKGAFLDPASNDSTQGPYTSTAAGVLIPVDDPDNGVYMIRVQRPGLDTVYSFVWACGAACFDAGHPRLGAGHLYPAGATPILTGYSLTTNVQTSPLVDGTVPPPGGVIPAQGTSYVPISGSVVHPASSSGGVPADVSGGTFALKSISGRSPDCDATTGNPGFIAIGCVSGGIAVTAYVGLTVCPDCRQSFIDAGGFTYWADVGDCTTPTDYSAQVNAWTSPFVLRSKVTSVEYNPFRVRGTWDAAYGQLGTYATLDGGATPRSMTDPGPSLTPLSGDFVIE